MRAGTNSPERIRHSRRKGRFGQGQKDGGKNETRLSQTPGPGLARAKPCSNPGTRPALGNSRDHAAAAGALGAIWSAPALTALWIEHGRAATPTGQARQCDPKRRLRRRTPKAPPRRLNGVPHGLRQPKRFPGPAQRHASETARKHGTAFGNSQTHAARAFRVARASCP